MSKIESATQWMINLANDDSHGYDQANRWGPDYDCSSAVVTAWQQAGVPVKSNGASTTRNMRSVFLNCGFSDVVTQVNLTTGAGLKRGDVLLRPGSHTAMSIGGGQMAHASLNEFGGIEGGHPGDQTGREILIQAYYNKPWECVLRYTAEGSGGFEGNPIVQAGQIHANNFCGAGIATDGIRGDATKKAGIKVTQTAMNLDYNAGLEVDGVWGPASSTALGTHSVKKGEVQYMVTALEILLMLKGYNPGGVEFPGVFGDGLEAAVRKYNSDKGWEVNGVAGAGTFKSLMY